MVDKSVLVTGDVVKDTENGFLYLVKAIHPERDEIRVVRLHPRNDVRRKVRNPYQVSGHYKPCSRFEEAICPEVLE